MDKIKAHELLVKVLQAQGPEASMLAAEEAIAWIVDVAFRPSPKRFVEQAVFGFTLQHEAVALIRKWNNASGEDETSYDQADSSSGSYC